jgi:hypothetical protein
MKSIKPIIMIKNFPLSGKYIFKAMVTTSLCCSSFYFSYAQFDTIPINKGPKASFTTWSYTGVIDITDNNTGHSVSDAYELRANNADIIYSPMVKVTASGNVLASAKFNLVNYQEKPAVGQVSLSVIVDAGTSNSTNYTNIAMVSGKSTWAAFSYSGYLLSGTHTYQAYFSNPSGNPIAVDDLNFGFTGATSITLPVAINSFRSSTAANGIVLNWSTLTESNNKGFYIERSNEGGVDYNNIGFIATKAINGNSNSNVDYSFVDAFPLAGNNFYRLKQVDIDGTQTFSSVTMTTIKAGTAITIYPNPATNNITISGAENGALIKIIGTASGQTILTSTLSSSTLDVSKLLPGNYTLEIQSQGKTVALKFMKL